MTGVGLFTYQVINGNEIEITDYPTTEAGDVAIPAEIDGKPVTNTGSNAFFFPVFVDRLVGGGTSHGVSGRAKAGSGESRNKDREGECENRVLISGDLKPV